MGIDKAAILPYNLVNVKGVTMNNSININQFAFMCNEYLNDSSNVTFNYFLSEKQYIKTNFDDEIKFQNVDKLISKSTKQSVFNFENTAMNRKKLAMIVDFFANNCTKIEDYKKSTKANFLRDITNILAKGNINLSLSKESFANLTQNVAMYDKNMYVPKSHPKLNFLRKKVLTPALIVGAGCGIGASILSTISIVANSSFISPNLLVSIGAWASAGAVIGGVATAVTSIAVNKLTRLYYSKKYCQKSNTLEALKNANIESIEELESSNIDLPIKRLIEKLQKTNQKVCKNKHSNWFNRVVMNGAIYKKIHRNQLWALASYIEFLKETEMNPATSTEQAQRCSLLLGYIDKYLSADMRENFKDYSSNYKKLDNCDIYATIALGKAKKDDLNEIKEKCYSLVKNLSMERYSKSNNEHLFNLQVMSKFEDMEQAETKTQTLYLPEPKNLVKAIADKNIIYLPSSLDPAKEIKEDVVIEEVVDKTINDTNNDTQTQSTEQADEPTKTEEKLIVKRINQNNEKQFKTISFKIDASFVRLIKLQKNYKQSFENTSDETNIVKLSKTKNSDHDIDLICKETVNYISSRLAEINNKFGNINDVIIKGSLKNQNKMEKSFVKTLKGSIPTNAQELLLSVEELIKVYLATGESKNLELTEKTA